MKNQKQQIVVLIALLWAFALVYFMKPDWSITGYSIIDRVESFTVGRAFSSIGPIVIFSLLLAAGVVWLHELYKK